MKIMRPWRERVNALSVNPNAATHEHIVRMATELHGFWLNEKKQYRCKSHSAGTGCINGETELINRIADLYNYVQAVRNQLDQIDSAIERLKKYAESQPQEYCLDVNCPHKTGITS